MPELPAAGTFLPPDDDGRWKDALDDYLGPCLALFWPALHARIDFGQAPVFLDKELQRIGGALRDGRRHVDKLARVFLKEGKDLLLLLHLEVQARPTPDFARRMFVYHYRLRERHPREDLMQFAILTRSASRARHAVLKYAYAPLDGQYVSLTYRFPVVHLSGWAGQRQALLDLARANPFAIVVIAELDAARRHTSAARLASKVALVRLLYEHGYGASDVRRLFTFIDGVLTLAPEHEPAFLAALNDIEGEHPMAYITSVERAGIRKGLEQGLERGRADGMRNMLRAQMQRRFGELAPSVLQTLEAADPDQLQAWSLRVLDADSAERVVAPD
ncbi:hypothetical protein FOZ76_02135 [Verticiella sediminum]|uniref:DUF4351 domain-containing protein n=1 Tax=Verticiella sediminum TaxID=1247510 RepID=A0A556B065_9BURK|nr:hypothetical protein [Verticiella sediminum]TSH98573.1 hypothetical protein FOZ76_02135 [Verticiella sediminum]